LLTVGEAVVCNVGIEDGLNDGRIVILSKVVGRLEGWLVKVGEGVVCIVGETVGLNDGFIVTSLRAVGLCVGFEPISFRQ